MPPPHKQWPSGDVLERIKQRLHEETLVEKAYLAWVTWPGRLQGCLQLGIDLAEGGYADAVMAPLITERLYRDVGQLVRLDGGVRVVNALRVRGLSEDYVREIPCIYCRTEPERGGVGSERF